MQDRSASSIADAASSGDSMGLLIGFTTILAVIACGTALAHVGVLDARSQRTLSEIAFFVASPALMVVTISGTHVGGAATNLAASAAALAASFGLGLAATDLMLPPVVEEPLRLIAAAAIPLMLMSSGRNREVVLVLLLKLGFMPVVAWLVGTALGLDGPVLLGVVMTAALPTAQNIFLHATRYRVGEDVSRESILVTTLCSLPVALLVAVLLG